ncbi:phosphopantetheine binding protein [Alteromonadaceae bacterium 2753L.S.0a.02]|nr:phosphopantetheine binding protein [Alteromonadaceae bacterium 2753L.S.0a.02]
MPTLNVYQDIKTFIANDILDGEDLGELDETTPLLELGVLNSMELMKLVDHIEQTYGVKVPGNSVVPGNFQDIQSITRFIETLGQTA